MDYKPILSAKKLKKRVLNIIKDFFACVGFLMMISETLIAVLDYDGLLSLYKSHYILIIITILVVCIWKNWDRLSFTVKIADSPDVTITLEVCDVLSKRSALIIPTNSTFDTKMDDVFISKYSVQGQYQMKYFKDRLGELDRKIDEGLSDKKFSVLNDGRKTKNKRYNIGTVCRISERNRRAYFLADSDINKKGIPINVDDSCISRALMSLWESLAKEGNNEPYRIPLLGTGKAGAKNVSRDDAVKGIIISFLAAMKDHKITESLTICIHPKDYVKINWEGLCEFLRFKAQYSNIKPHSSKPEGTAEST